MMEYLSKLLVKLNLPYKILAEMIDKAH